MSWAAASSDEASSGEIGVKAATPVAGGGGGANSCVISEAVAGGMTVSNPGTPSQPVLDPDAGAATGDGAGGSGMVPVPDQLDSGAASADRRSWSASA